MSKAIISVVVVMRKILVIFTGVIVFDLLFYNRFDSLAICGLQFGISLVSCVCSQVFGWSRVMVDGIVVRNVIAIICRCDMICFLSICVSVSSVVKSFAVR